MREAFGGGFMIKMVLVFIVVYVSFMAVAVNYARAFRVKNGIINILEQYEYSGNQQDVALDKVAIYLGSINYNYTENQIDLNHYCNDGMFITASNFSSLSSGKVGGGYCLQKIETEDSNSFYYKVTTYIVADVPFLNPPVLSVNGETKIIHAR